MGCSRSTLIRHSSALALLVLASFLGACLGGPRPEFKYSVNTQFGPQTQELFDGQGRPRPLAGVRSRDGVVVSEFAVNEIVLCPEFPEELSDFLARTGGEVVSSDAVPEPPEGTQSRLSPEDRAAKCFTVRLDASGVGLERFAEDSSEMMVAAGVEKDAEVEISSEPGARLLALVVREAAAGLRVSANFVGYGNGDPRIMNFTRERSNGDGTYANAMAIDRFKSSLTGSHSSVAQAWQWMAQRGLDRKVRVGIIDGGFLIQETTGRPWDRQLSTGLSDYRVDTYSHGLGVPLQYDHAEGDRIVEGPARMRCSGGSECPWHGRGSAITAVGWADNQWGDAGTGGMIGIPILQNVSGDLAQWKGGINTSLDWGAEVISMSIGFGCDNVFCEIGIDMIDFWGPFERAVLMGVPVIASAGNNMTDVDASQYYPCGVRDVICVGAIADGTLDRIGYSNWGATRVDIWAPTNIPLREPLTSDELDPLEPSFHGGTSAAAPFVAGVVAMMKSVNPGLSVDEVRTILRATATTDTTDARVTHAVNALEALRMSYTGPFPDDAMEPNDSTAAPKRIPVGAATSISYPNLFVTPTSPVDIYEFEIAEWSRLIFRINSPRTLTALSMQLRRLGGIQPTLTWGPAVWEGRTQAYFDDVAPGRYQLTVRAGSSSLVREMMYDLEIERQTRGIPLPADEFEYNDSSSFPKWMTSRGTRHANFHSSSDVDYYRYTVAEGGVEEFSFVIRASDGPVRVTVFDTDAPTVPIATQVGSAGLEVSISEAGAYFIRVEAEDDAIGRYIFTDMGRLRNLPNAPQFTPDPYAGFWIIDPAWVFFDSSVIEAAEYFLLPPNPGNIDIVGRGPVQLDVYDLEANHLAAGTIGDDGQGNPVTRVSLKGVGLGQQAVLRVMRSGYDIEGLQSGELPPTPFSLQRDEL